MFESFLTGATLLGSAVAMALAWVIKRIPGLHSG